MKIAIIGGGLVGLTSAYYLSKKGYKVVLFEKEAFCGGLASGFKDTNWDWHLERTYHHVFSNDNEILNFSNEIGFNSFFFASPQTASLYNSRIFPVDTPQDFIKFPLLSIPEKLRAGVILAFLQVSPFFSFYEKETACVFLKRTMGERVWVVMWENLFQKKFGKYAEKIVASFIWARISKRTKRLGYPTGGFQNFINYLVDKNIEQGVDIKKSSFVEQITKSGTGFVINYLGGGVGGCQKRYVDAVISTLPTPVFLKKGKGLFEPSYVNQLKKITYLSAVNLILETNIPILEKTYWLSVCDKENPIMCVVQHTNFINKNHYGDNHISYVANYVDFGDWLLQASKEEIINKYAPHLKTLNSQFSILNSYLFRAPYAQPIYDDIFVKNKPELMSPIKNLYIANLEMTYPYDRGTNYAVRLGKQVAGMI